jgi:glycosyltransferase involved in cell wall biosynthesis
VNVLCYYAGMLPELLHKAMGQIPLHLAREVGWSARLVYHQLVPDPVLVPEGFEDDVALECLGSQPTRWEAFRSFLPVLIREAPHTDVFLQYHLSLEMMVYAAVYKALRPDGVCALKLDMDSRALEAFDARASLKQRLLLEALGVTPFDFATIETHAIERAIAPTFARLDKPLHYLPVGHPCEPPLDLDEVLAGKENLILVTGRIGMPQKHHELLLDALVELGAEALGDWRAMIVGRRTEAFDAYVARLRADHPRVMAKVELRDFVADRAEIHAIYRRARVFVLSSRWESFGTVLVEAGYHGCFLVSTEVGGAPDVTDDGRDGLLFPIEDRAALASHLRAIIAGEVDTAAGSRRVHARIREQFSWAGVARRLASMTAAARALRPPGPTTA